MGGFFEGREEGLEEVLRDLRERRWEPRAVRMETMRMREEFGGGGRERRGILGTQWSVLVSSMVLFLLTLRLL